MRRDIGIGALLALVTVAVYWPVSRAGGQGPAAVGRTGRKIGKMALKGAPPEPATMALLGLGAVALLAKRRRK